MLHLHASRQGFCQLLATVKSVTTCMNDWLSEKAWGATLEVDHKAVS